MRITDSIVDAFDRVRPARKLPAARRRAEDSEVLGEGVKVENAKLQEERDRLAREFVVLQWDLGGLTYEMARRDHFRLDVLARQAAKLQQVDSSLGQAERMLRLEQDGVAGTCTSCGALQARGAAFCWQCGTELVAAGAVTGEAHAPAPADVPSAPAQAPAVQLPGHAPETVSAGEQAR